ncbi:YbhB/YbcL family Raf kinase inhibitor-like protein [Natronomonas marina]|jgi:phosphatidylethanolamine-binding protein (PEBP) family uncharacterized protein|uniref:YbhB/YbcL family Raf kinase inhibitor-like protein n=1 Tax=Natronomonas marina TaxID=2961939 RepID=UPI0020C99376|nr:YbhB/YbcL family Raf kinase inhibitor-like protein [Natronomonas marina]
MRRRALLASIPSTVAAASAGCTIGGEPPDGTGLSISSPAFEASIPVRFTCDGAGESPPLTVSGVPPETESLAVVGEWLRSYDPGTIWTLWNLPPEDPLRVPADRPNEHRLESPAGARQGQNGEGTVGYRSPCHETPGENEYRFTVFALESAPDLEPGADRDAFDDAVEPLIAASNAFTATYDRF